MSPAALPTSLSALNAFHSQKSLRPKVRKISAALPVRLDGAPPPAASLPYRVSPKSCHRRVSCRLHRVVRRWNVRKRWSRFDSHPPSSNGRPTNIANVVSRGQKSISNKPRGEFFLTFLHHRFARYTISTFLTRICSYL